jgi:hypothetical protein
MPGLLTGSQTKGAVRLITAQKFVSGLPLAEHVPENVAGVAMVPNTSVRPVVIHWFEGKAAEAV